MDNAIEYLNTLLQESSYAATLELVPSEETKFHLATNIRKLHTEKRKLEWKKTKEQCGTRYPQDKTELNKVARKLSKMLHELKNENLKNKLKHLQQQIQLIIHYGR